MSEHQNEYQAEQLHSSEEPADPQQQIAGTEAERVAADPPRIWVGSLADYNNGVLHGEWLDAGRDPDVVHTDIAAMLARSEQPAAEEWGIFDYENFGHVRLGEYESIDTVSQVARGIIEHGPAFAAWAELHDCQPEMLESFQDAYLGAFDSPEAWAETIVDDFGIDTALTRGLPEFIAAHVHIDYAGLAHDLQIAGDVHIENNPEGGIWVFDSR
jgi:antirestriction protein